MRILKNISLVVLIAGYTFAGINHFWHPGGYISIIPRYIPYPVLMNTLAGIFEISFALMLIWPGARPWAVYGIILMLAAFLPVHIDMALHAPLQVGSLNVTPFTAWLRVAFQPALMLWVWWHAKA
ncbi:DoxX family protein [Mucilaginibacter sp. FT3.2]|uniref:DoxX family protein n=1 Tax=Mucilaginibacter sp. FT3.2 TaxID=2723090 RepID=UPI0016212322|nr:DoxX family protein [Mucilaginibacter sp. FT3.2]MBB6231365.1 putative membrane protein [Mucilaginibacter sp. FT3.2]